MHLAPYKGSHIYSIFYLVRGVIEPESVIPDQYGNLVVDFEIEQTHLSLSDLIGPPPEATFKLDPLLQIEFNLSVPWLLDEPEPT